MNVDEMKNPRLITLKVAGRDFLASLQTGCRDRTAVGFTGIIVLF